MDINTDPLDIPSMLSTLELLASSLDQMIERGINLKDRVEDLGMIISDAYELSDSDPDRDR